MRNRVLQFERVLNTALFVLLMMAGITNGNASVRSNLNTIESDFTTYSVVASSSPIEGGVITGTGTYYEGDTCTLTAMANEGYMFDHWIQDGEVVSYLSTYSFTVTESVEVVAVFMSLSGTLVGGAEGTNEYLPSYSFYKYTLSQQIYTPEEIGGADVISSISYFNTGGTKTRSYDIYMVHTDKTVFESNADWIAVTEADLVFSGDVTMAQGCWNTIILDTPFAYDGTLNLAVVVDDNSGNWTGQPHMSCRVFNTDGSQAIRVYSDNPNYDPYNPSEYSGTLYSEKNQMLLNRQQCIVSAVSNSSSMGSVDGSGLYAPGDTCTLTATANGGYCFYYWTENGAVVSSDATYSFTVTRDRELVANFGSPLYVSATADPWEGGVVTGSGEYEYGATCTLTVTANQGYTFMYWTENGQQVSSNTTYSFTVTADRNLVANFALPFSVTATANPEEGGSVTGAGEYDYGSICTLTATANEGYVFRYWTSEGSVVSFAESYSFTVTGNLELVANFVPLYTITVTANPDVGGSVWMNGFIYRNTILTHGEEYETPFSWTEPVAVNVTADKDPNATSAPTNTGNRAPWDLMMTFTAPEGGHYGVAYDGNNFYTSNWGYSSAAYNFYKYDLSGNMLEGFNISGCGTLRGMTYDGQYFYGVANSSTVYCVDLANHSVVSTFTSAYGAMRGITYDPERDGFWVIGNWSGNLTLIDRTGAIQFAGPAPTSASDLAYYKDENNVEHVFCFNNGDNGVYDYNITTNTMGGSVFNFNSTPGATGTSGGCTVGYFNGKTAFIGDLQQSPNLIAVYELKDGGGVGPTSGPGLYYQGKTCILRADPNNGFAFSNWTENGEIVSSDSIYSFTVESDRVLVANFVPIENHWTAIEGTPSNMFMIGLVTIDGVEQTSPYLELVAFCNGDCRGSEFPFEEEGRWLYFMSIGGNTGDDITFRLYDHALQQELDLYCYNVLPLVGSDFIGLDNPYEVLFANIVNVSVDVNPEGAGTVSGAGEYVYGTTATLAATANEGYAFNSWTLDGEIVSTEPSYTFTVTEPVSLTANFDFVQSLQLFAGWNWFSTYLDITLDDLKSALVAVLPDASIKIKSKNNGQTTWNGSVWIGGLKTMNVTQMYKINVSTDCVITLQGLPINPADHPVTIKNGANWIAFPLSESITVSNAFAGFAVNGDMVKSRTNGTAAYYGTIWMGGLKNLIPGQGYIYKSNAQGDRTYTFPISTK